MRRMSILRDELTNDPLALGYIGMTDEQVVISLNTLNRTAKGGIAGMMEYLLNNKNRTNTGTDTVASAILGRLHHVADSAIGSDPFGSTIVVTNEMKHAAQSFLDLLHSPHLLEIDFDGIDLPYVRCTDAGIWKIADVSALKALSTNKQSRANELGLGRVRLGHVQEVRA